ncbi:MAG TPA: hypothetical protein VF708_15690 [Pyrinomonadaceae bacterium]|jgi:hypothetical protein
MQKQEAEEIFEIVCKDAQIWLTQANQLKMSADVIKVELQNAIPLLRFEPSLNDTVMAFVKSYMLLTAMAFENLIKGIMLGRDSSSVNREFINRSLLPKGGHGISEGAKRVSNISGSEDELLRRLEEYLVWAGRYPMPLRSEVFFNSQSPENLRSFSMADFERIEKLFSRLSGILLEEWNARERSKYI